MHRILRHLKGSPGSKSFFSISSSLQLKAFSDSDWAMYPNTVRNPSVSLSPTLTRNEKVEHYIRIKTHKPIALRFWVESGVNILCG